MVFYELYKDKNLENSNETLKAEDVLNQWILSRLNQVLKEVTMAMESYDMTLATRPIEIFVEDLSTWYLRRSRDKIKDGDVETKNTLYFVLKTIAKVMAPFAPFASEDIWLKLRNEKDAESVHLESWPEASKVDVNISENMELVRNIVSLGLEARQKAKIQVRQPLAKLEVKNINFKQGQFLFFKEKSRASEYLELIKDELNVRDVVENSGLETEVKLDTEITDDLKQEGNYRELVRALQDLRKKTGLTPSDVVVLTMETGEAGRALVEKFMEDMKRVVLLSKVEFAGNDGDVVKLGDLEFKVQIKK